MLHLFKNMRGLLFVLLVSGCGPTVIPVKNPPPYQTWEMAADAYVINLSADGVEDPYLKLNLASDPSPTTKLVLTLPEKKRHGFAVEGVLSESSRIRIVDLFYKNTTLFSGFWMKVEILSGEMKGRVLTLPDLFYVARSEKGSERSFKYKGSYYRVVPIAKYVRSPKKPKEASGI